MPSFPATIIRLDDYKDFDDYLARRLSKATRKSLRRKFRPDADGQPPITMEVRTDVTDCVDEIHPLYLQVLARSCVPFRGVDEGILSPGWASEMGDRARFFIWRQEGPGGGGQPVHGPRGDALR